MGKFLPTRSAVEDAFNRYDSGERQDGRGAARSTYVMSSNGKTYPAKHIWGLATGERYFQTQEAEAGFIKLGFQVVEKGIAQDEGAIGNLTINTIAIEINNRSSEYDIGNLQNIRKNLKGFKQRASPSIFHNRTMFPSEEGGYCFHDGGRTELQFNIAYEPHDAELLFRHGLAFSLELGQSLPTIDPLLPRIKRFNDYITSNFETFSDMRLWVWNGEVRSANHFAGPIPVSWIKAGAFIVLGKINAPDDVIYDDVLSDFDRLLTLYCYVESTLEQSVEVLSHKAPFKFKSGFSKKRSNSKSLSAERKLDVRLLHNDMQFALCEKLSQEFGNKNIGEEVPNGLGGSIDVVLKKGLSFWFYEIKTFGSPKACIREALGQLLEYAYWPGTMTATKLIVVGPNVIDRDGTLYLAKLRELLNLPIYYEDISATE